MTLRRLLELLRTLYQAVMVGAHRVPISDAYRGILGHIADVAEQVDLFRPLPQRRDEAAPPDLLRGLFRHLRQLRGSPTGPAFMPERWGVQGLLLMALMELPVTADPLIFLQSEQGCALCAFLVLSDILTQCLPGPNVLTGMPALRMHQPMAVIRSAQGFEGIMEQVIYKQSGFALHVRARLMVRDLPLLATLTRLTLQWEGFDRVVDDLGYSYLIVATHLACDIHPWGSEERLTMTCYPAVVPEARELIFTSRPIVILVFDEQPAYSVPLPALRLGDLVWHTPVSS